MIDLYQIHWPNPSGIEEGWEAIAELVREGKVRYGASPTSTSADGAHPGDPSHGVPPASLQHAAAGRGGGDAPVLRRPTIGVITYSPMQMGLLTGKVTP